MNEPILEPDKETLTTLLLNHYGFELGRYNALELVESWSSKYPTKWIRLAVIEALYQGRYKAVSVTQILETWMRRNRPLYHFNHEFETLICSKFAKYIAETAPTTQTSQIIHQSESESESPTESDPDPEPEPEINYITDYNDLKIIITNSHDHQPPPLSPKSSNPPIEPEPTQLETLSSSEELIISPIQQFSPPYTDSSYFYRKLKAVAHNIKLGDNS